jgi:glycosyltransferase involved in cell wall biosynthesis
MGDILFSVITISYNSSQFLKQTIESVLAQSYQAFEYVIGDDCSIDDSWQIIQHYTDARIKRFRNETNLGEYANRAKALQNATGQYVIFIDGDDIIYNNALQVLFDYVNKFPECAMLFLREWDHRILFPYKVEPADIYRFEFLDGGITGGNFTKVLFKREVLSAYPFPSGIRSGDTYIQLKIAQKYAGLVIPDGLTWWRRRKGNATEALFRDERHLIETIKYRIGLLNDGCPLPENEKEQAKINIYGLYLRQLVKLALRFKWPMVFYLAKRIHVPKNYYKCIFIPAKFNYYKNITGDEPLHTSSISENKLLNNI